MMAGVKWSTSSCRRRPTHLLKIPPLSNHCRSGHHQWINRTRAQYSIFFGTRLGDKVRWWVPTFLLPDAQVGWWRAGAIDWQARIEQLRGLIAAAQARKLG